jgi:hypothetical protein
MKRDVLVFANHNPYESQDVKLTFTAKVREVEFFDRANKKWVALKPGDAGYTFKVEDYGVELVRISR